MTTVTACSVCGDETPAPPFCSDCQRHLDRGPITVRTCTVFEDLQPTFSSGLVGRVLRDLTFHFAHLPTAMLN